MVTQESLSKNAISRGMKRATRFVAVTLTLICFSVLPVFAQSDLQSKPIDRTLLKDVSRADLEGLIRDYILDNPEIIIEALERLESRNQAEALARQQEKLSENSDILFSSEHQVIYGNPDGDVTLVEFFDYNCGFCRRSLQDIERLVENDPNLKIVLKEFPVLGPGSQSAAQVAIAAAKIDPQKYITLHKQLLSFPGQVDERIALRLAEKLDYDIDRINEVLERPVVVDAINEVYAIATDLGLTGTPTFVIGQEILPGAVGYDILNEKITAMRECGKTVCS